MVKLSTIEVSLGAIALCASAAGSFLIAGGQVDQLPAFVALSLTVFAVTAAIVVSRISHYQMEMRARLIHLLPAERACQPDAIALDSLTETELFEQLAGHQKEQDALLSENYHVLIQSRTNQMDDLLQVEDELRQLRSEISALEDQFRTDQNRLQGFGLSSGFFRPGDGAV